MTAREVALFAQKLRARAKQTAPPYSTRAIVDVVRPDILVTGHKLPPTVRALVTPGAEGPMILYRRGLSTPEQRIAIAHELAHVLWDMAKPRTTAVAEARADMFAAELLAPAREICRRLAHVTAPHGIAEHMVLDAMDEVASLYHVPVRILEIQLVRGPRPRRRSKAA